MYTLYPFARGKQRAPRGPQQFSFLPLSPLSLSPILLFYCVHALLWPGENARRFSSIGREGDAKQLCILATRERRPASSGVRARFQSDDRRIRRREFMRPPFPERSQEEDAGSQEKRKTKKKRKSAGKDGIQRANVRAMSIAFMRGSDFRVRGCIVCIRNATTMHVRVYKAGRFLS